METESELEEKPPRIKWRDVLSLAVVTALLGAVLIAEAEYRKSEQPKSVATTPKGFDDLAHNPSRIRQLSDLALTSFKNTASSAQGINVFVDTGICDLIRTQSGSVKLVPDPASISIIDQQTGTLLTENFAYDPKQHNYVVGNELLVGNGGRGPERYFVSQNNQYTVPVQGIRMGLSQTQVRFASAENKIVVDYPGYENKDVSDSVMSVIEPGKSLGQIAAEASVADACSLAITGKLPPQPAIAA